VDQRRTATTEGAVSLSDILSSLPDDGADSRRREEVEAELRRLRARLQDDPMNVSEEDTLGGIEQKFDLECCGDFLDDADWLMEALKFTKEPAPTDPSEIRGAWERYLDEAGDRLPYDQYPILEGIADWYYGRSDDLDMAARAVSVYEYLFSAVHDRTVEFEPSDYVRRMIRLWKQLKNVSRAKFLVQWAEERYHARLLSHEEYLDLAKIWAELVVEERGDDLTECERDLNKILRIAWDTISHRDRRREELSERNQRLSEEIARARDATYPQAARRRLEAKFGITWTELHETTRRELELGETYSHSPYSDHSPGIVPTAFFQAVKAEIMARVFEPYGRRNPALLACIRDSGANPVRMLINYAGKRLGNLADRKAIREALAEAACTPGFLSKDYVKKLKLLCEHRDQAQHPEDNPPYDEACLEELLQGVWLNNWIVVFLGALNGNRAD
jgi:hypothetical protein